MRRIIGWYKKWNQDLETNFLSALLKLNGLTNSLLMLSLYTLILLRALVTTLSGGMELSYILNLVFWFLSFSPVLLILAYGIPNVFVLLFLIFRWFSLREKEANSKDRQEEFRFKNSHDKYTAVLWFGLFGCFIESLFIFWIKDLTFYDWQERLINNQKHAMIWTGAYPTFFTLAFLCLLALIVYSYRDANSLSPLVNVFCMGGILTGILLLIVFDLQVQVFSLHTVFLLTYSIQLLRIRIREWQEKEEGRSYNHCFLQLLHRYLNQSRHWPWLALLLALPSLAVVVMILLLFGQEPDSIIKAWTNTADWTFSEQIPPQYLVIDEHYLCTVAAAGHRRVVKPLRMGQRHGHPVVVNRQLLIANAFEQVLEEKVPTCHRLIRSFYDRYGYPFAQHIQHKWMMDGIYLLMKPLEWLFLLVLYLVDRQPENRIAMQYIQPIPEDFKSEG